MQLSGVEILAITAASLTVLNVVGGAATWLHNKHVNAVAAGVVSNLDTSTPSPTPVQPLTINITVTGITDVSPTAPRHSTVMFHEGV